MLFLNLGDFPYDNLIRYQLDQLDMSLQYHRLFTILLFLCAGKNCFHNYKKGLSYPKLKLIFFRLQKLFDELTKKKLKIVESLDQKFYTIFTRIRNSVKCLFF